MDTPAPSPQGPATLPPQGAEALLTPLGVALDRFLDATISIGAYATHQHAFWAWSVGSAHARCGSRDQVAQDIPAIARLLLGIETGDTEFLVQSDAGFSSFHTHSADDARRLWHARQVMKETSDTFQRVMRADSLTRR